LIGVKFRTILFRDYEMDLTRILDQLRHELDHIDTAILSLERLQLRRTPRETPENLD